MLEHGDPTTDISFNNALAIKKFPSKFAKEIVARAESMVSEAKRNDNEVAWVFGDHKARLEACRHGLQFTVLQIAESQTLEEYMDQRKDEGKVTSPKEFAFQYLRVDKD
jgi:hypothetical protein